MRLLLVLAALLLVQAGGKASGPGKSAPETSSQNSLSCDVSVVDGSLGWLCGAPRNAGLSLLASLETTEATNGSSLNVISGSPHVDGMMYRSVGSIGSFWEHRSSEGLVTFSMSSLWIVGLSGSLFERFHNGESWVYIQHALPEGTTALHASVINQSVVAHTSTGEALLRTVSADRRLYWQKILIPDETVLSTFRSADTWRGNPGAIWAVSVSGDLWGLTPNLDSWQQILHPRGNPILALADTRWLRDRSIFAISAHGTLWELTHNAVWRHHRPPRTAHGQAILLAPMSGIVAPLQGSKHIYMLLLAADGSGLVERGWTGEKFWWRFHPAPDGVTLGGPLTLIFVPSRGSREIHASVVVLALNGTALEFNTWTAHQPSLAGRLEPGDVWGVLDVPGGALAPVAGAVIDDGGQVIHIFMLADGCLAEYRPEGFSPGRDGIPKTSFGKWSVHEVPESEGGNAAYCSVQAGLNHCLTGTRPAGYRPEQRPAKDDSAWGGSIRAAIRDEWAPSPGLGGPALPPRPGAATPPAPSALQLRVMDPRSLLVVGKAAVVYERSFSGRAKQAWVKHKHPSKLSRIAATMQSAMVAVDDRGALHLWEFDDDGAAQPRQIGMAVGRQYGSGSAEVFAVPVVGAGPLDATLDRIKGKGRPNLFFMGGDGHLKELRGVDAGRAPMWRDIGPVPARHADGTYGFLPAGRPEAAKAGGKGGKQGGGKKDKDKDKEKEKEDAAAALLDGLPVIADSQVLRMHCVFVVGRDGLLHMYNGVSGLWSSAEAPGGARLALAQGAAVRAPDGPAGSLFLVTRNGSMVERAWEWREADSPHGRWRWAAHGRPESLTLASVGPALPDRSAVFATTTDGQVARRYRTKAGGWAWDTHGWPLMGATELKGSPRALAVVANSTGLLLRPTAVALSLEAGVIGVLQMQGAGSDGKGGAWSWTVVDVPAGVDGGTADSKSRRKHLLATVVSAGNMNVEQVTSGAD